MIDLQVYAPGLRESDNITHLGHSLETNPDVHYKVDSEHDMVYFEFLEPTMTLREIRRTFTDLGLEPRFVGIIPDEFSERTKTQRIK